MINRRRRRESREPRLKIKREKRDYIVTMRTEEEEIRMKEGERVEWIINRDDLKASINEGILEIRFIPIINSKTFVNDKTITRVIMI